MPWISLSSLRGVDLDEGGERCAGGEELARERLPRRACAPDDRGSSVREERSAQVVRLAAPEGGERVRRVGAGEPLRVVAPAEDERLQVAEAAAALPDPQHEVVVLGPAAIAVGEELGPRGEAGPGQRALDPDVAQRCLDGDEGVEPIGVRPQPVGGLGEVLDPAPDRVETLLLDRRNLELEPLRQRDVVGVHAGDQRRPRLHPRALGGGHHTRRLLAQDAKAGVGARVRLQDRGRGVGRAVVDRDHLECRERLRRQRLQTLGEKGLLVPRRQKDGYPRPAHSGAGAATDCRKRRSR